MERDEVIEYKERNESDDEFDEVISLQTFVIFVLYPLHRASILKYCCKTLYLRLIIVYI